MGVWALLASRMPEWVFYLGAAVFTGVTATCLLLIRGQAEARLALMRPPSTLESQVDSSVSGTGVADHA